MQMNDVTPYPFSLRFFFGLVFAVAAGLLAWNGDLWLTTAVAPVAYVFGLAHGSKGKLRPGETRDEMPGYARRSQARVSFEDMSDDVVEEVRQKIRAGGMIAAIKMIRNHTGGGLKEAKDLAEHIREEGTWK